MLLLLLRSVCGANAIDSSPVSLVVRMCVCAGAGAGAGVVQDKHRWMREKEKGSQWERECLAGGGGDGHSRTLFVPFQ